MIKNTINPEWNFIADFPIEVVKGQTLHIQLMDHDDPGKNVALDWCWQWKTQDQMIG